MKKDHTVGKMPKNTSIQNRNTDLIPIKFSIFGKLDGLRAFWCSRFQFDWHFLIKLALSEKKTGCLGKTSNLKSITFFVTCILSQFVSGVCSPFNKRNDLILLRNREKNKWAWTSFKTFPEKKWNKKSSRFIRVSSVCKVWTWVCRVWS